MPTLLSKTDRLLFTYGDIQVSPQQVVALNQQPPILHSRTASSSAPPAAGYAVLLSGYSHFILQQERQLNSHQAQVLDTTLTNLKSTPRPLAGKLLKGSTDTRRLKTEYHFVDYEIASGQVFVFNIQPIPKIQQLRNAQERTALYRVTKKDGIWSVGNPVKTVATSFAAVNGQSNNLAKATWLMGAHLEVAHGKSVAEYTLFHNPSDGGSADTWESFRDKVGLTTDVTKFFSKALEEAQKTGRQTTWVAHSQGGIIFSEGVRYLLNNSSSNPFHNLRLNGLNSEDKGHLLNRQRVNLHGSGSNTWRSKHLFERAGVELLAVRAHDYDLVHQIVGINTLNPRKLIGAAVYSTHVFDGSVAQSPHTTIQPREQWEKHMKDGPGKGRNTLQKAFHHIESFSENTARLIKNYLP